MNLIILFLVSRSHPKTILDTNNINIVGMEDDLPEANYKNDWKMITIQIGSKSIAS